MDNLQQIEHLTYTVSKFAELTSQALKSFGLVRICGEVSSVNLQNHLYFTLKDEQSSVDCIIFKNQLSSIPFSLQVGQQVIISAECSLYKKTSRFSLHVKQVELTGIGRLMIQLEILEKRLRQEGLIPHPYREAPRFFYKVLVITSCKGLVLYDIANNVWRRNPAVHLHFINAKVQGIDAPNSLVRALDFAGRMALEQNYDAVILARGGGSFEDLLCFSDEQVVRAVARCPVYIISAIGHDKDWPLCDLVADKRVSTPTAAAELITPVTLDEASMFLSNLCERLNNAVERRYNEVLQYFDYLSAKIVSPQFFKSLQSQHELTRLRLERNIERMEHRMSAPIQHLEQRFHLVYQRLFNLDLQSRLKNVDFQVQTHFTHLSSKAESYLHELEKRIFQSEKSLNQVDLQQPLLNLQERVNDAFEHLGFSPNHPERFLDNVEKELQQKHECVNDAFEHLGFSPNHPERFLHNVEKELQQKHERVNDAFEHLGFSPNHPERFLHNVEKEIQQKHERVNDAFEYLGFSPNHPERFLQDLEQQLQLKQEQINKLLKRLKRSFQLRIKSPWLKQQQRFMVATTKLDLLDPIKRLQNGLSFTTLDGITAVEGSQVQEGQDLITLTSNTKIYSVVYKVEAYDPKQTFGQYADQSELEFELNNEQEQELISELLDDEFADFEAASKAPSSLIKIDEMEFAGKDKDHA